RRTMPEFVSTVAEHRPASLRGQRVAEVLVGPERSPRELIRLYRSWPTRPDRIRETSPTLTFAVLGQARASGLITPEREAALLRERITDWALRSTLETAHACAGIGRVPVLMGQPAIWRTGPASPHRDTAPEQRIA